MAAGLTLDSGALIAADKGTPRRRAIWRVEADRRTLVTVPAAVLAQVWRRNSPRIAILLQACEVEALDERAAKSVGLLLEKSRTADVVDAAVVLRAAARGDRIVTSDPEDIRRLLGVAGADESLVLEV